MYRAILARPWVLGLFVAIAAGIFLRLVWLEDVEYKADEAEAFALVQAFWQTHDLPMTGMSSSIGLPNPGLGLWVFIALSSIVPLDMPLALTRAVQLTNVGAILALAIFALSGIQRAEREPWLWSIALASVNPLAVLFSRKIWTPDLLPIFTLGMLVGWWYRGRWWGGLVWGLFGAALGQIHLSGFFFAAAFVLCILLFDRRSVRWRAWIIGTILGSMPMVPWLIELTTNFGHRHTIILMIREWPGSLLHYAIGNAPDDGGGFFPLGFLLNWLNMMSGIGLRSSLGADFAAFLSFPFHTHLVGLMAVCIILILATIVLRMGHRLYANRSQAVALAFGLRSTTALTLAAGFLGFGILLTAASPSVNLYYLVVAFPLPWLSLAWCAGGGSRNDRRSVAFGRALLVALVFAQAAFTMSFLAYVHQTEVINGDYGAVYRAQTHPAQSHPGE